MAAAAGQAAACSLTPDAFIPTNFEMVQLADAIVVATAVGEVGGEDEQQVSFRTDQVLKGPAPEAFKAGYRLGSPEPSDPHQLLEPHPESGAGACRRYTFAKGRQYVMFLERGADGSYIQAGYAFSRVNEDYSGEASLWVRTIRTYLDIQARHDPMGEIAALEALREAKARETGRDAKAQVQDISVQLATLSPYKPTAYLLAAYDALEKGGRPAYWGADVDGRWEPEAVKERVLQSLVRGDHPGAVALFDRLTAAPDPSAAQLGDAIRFYAKNGQYRRSFELAERDAMRILPALPTKEMAGLIYDIREAQDDGGYPDPVQRWRADAYTARAWPELALSLHWLEDRVRPGDARPDAAIRAIPVEDFRARPMLTMALVDAEDDRVTAWATAELSDDAKRRDWESSEHEYGIEDPALLPLRALLRMYGEDRDAVLVRVFCQSKDRRDLLIAELGEANAQLDTDLAARMAASSMLNDEERGLLGRSLMRLYAKEHSSGEPTRWSATASCAWRK